MAKSFRDLRARMSPDAQKAAERKANAMLAAMPICFFISSQTGHLSSVVQEHEHTIEETSSAPMGVQYRGIEGQLNLYVYGGASGAAVGDMERHSEIHWGSVFDEIVDKKHLLPYIPHPFSQF